MIVDAGLILFLCVQSANLAGLALDGVLNWFGRTTVTELVWAHPWVGAPILGLQVAGLVGLALHFYAIRLSL